MTRPPSETMTEREAQIMSVLWDRGRATADEVRRALPDQPHDSTVRTLLRVLERKGYVLREPEGRAYAYLPAVERAGAQRSALRGVLARFFGGSAEDLVLRLIEDEQLTSEQLDALRRSAPETPRQSNKSRRRKGGSR